MFLSKILHIVSSLGPSGEPGCDGGEEGGAGSPHLGGYNYTKRLYFIKSYLSIKSLFSSMTKNSQTPSLMVRTIDEH